MPHITRCKSDAVILDGKIDATVAALQGNFSAPALRMLSDIPQGLLSNAVQSKANVFRDSIRDGVWKKGHSNILPL